MTDDTVFMPIWTVYEHPTDYPDQFVARRFNILIDKPEPQATDDIVTAASLQELREMLPIGLTRIPRLHGDEPQIVEVWI